MFATNKGADQPAHLCSLISAFVIPFLESTISKVATSHISIFFLVSVAKETDLSFALSETPKTGFSCQGSYIKCIKFLGLIPKQGLILILQQRLSYMVISYILVYEFIKKQTYYTVNMISLLFLTSQSVIHHSELHTPSMWIK